MTITAAATITAAGSVGDPITVVEDALYLWVLSGSGLAADHVIWSDRAPIPAGTYIGMRLKGGKTVSDDWLKPEKTADNRIILHARGTRNPTLELTCFAGANFGSARCEAILSRVVAALAFPDIRGILRTGDVGIGTIGPPRTVDGVRSQMFDPRAIIEILLHTSIDVAREGSAIEHARATLQAGDVSRSASADKP